MEPKKVMIVEDDKMLSTISEMFLTNLGHEISGKYTTGQEAIEHCHKETPDVIIMDIHLKGDINGIETSRLIQEQWDIPIIFLSSDVSLTTVTDSVMKNTYGFLVKPVDKKNMGTTIEFAFQKHKFDRKKT